MFANDIVSLGSGAVSRTFSLTSLTDTKSVRSDPSAALGSPYLMTISHQAVNRGKNASTGAALLADRHLVRFDATFVGSDGIAKTVSIQCVAEVPQAAESEAIAGDLLTRLSHFVHTAAEFATNRDKLFNNEV